MNEARIKRQRSSEAPDIVRMNAEKDPDYRPYCMRCPGLVRMSIVERFLWACRCGAKHDARDPRSADAPIPDVIRHVPATGFDEGLARAEKVLRERAGLILKSTKYNSTEVTNALFDAADDIGAMIMTKPRSAEATVTRCGASTTVRDDEHMTFNCALDVGHHGDHCSGDGTCQWTDGDTMFDAEERDFREIRRDDSSPDAERLRAIASYVRMWADGDDAWHSIGHIASLFPSTPTMVVEEVAAVQTYMTADSGRGRESVPSKYEVRHAWGHADCEDAERWDGAFATREEAIEDGIDTYNGESFWIVVGTYPDPASFVPSAERIIDEMVDNACSNVGEVADDYSGSNEAEETLDAFLEAWARKHMPCEFYLADGAKERIDPSPSSRAGETNEAKEKP